MYYPHFGLQEAPFKITPNTDFFFAGGQRGAVLEALLYAVSSGEGIIKVVGEVGSGKTMLCRMLQSRLPAHIECIYLANPSVAPQDVLHAIAFELQLSLPEKSNRLLALHVIQRYLMQRHAEGKQVVIFIEEAQGMPIATLEEIRLLSNLETKHDKLLQIILFGQPELDENLNKNEIRQLRERITHSFYLPPLDQKTISEYLDFRLRAAGYHGPALFPPQTVRHIAGVAQGLIRRVNILADKCLLAAFAENTHQVTERHVKAAIRDSEFKQPFRLSVLFEAWPRKRWLGLFALMLLALIAYALFKIMPTFNWQQTLAPAAKLGQKEAPKPVQAQKQVQKETLHLQHPNQTLAVQPDAASADPTLTDDSGSKTTVAAKLPVAAVTPATPPVEPPVEHSTATPTVPHSGSSTAPSATPANVAPQMPSAPSPGATHSPTIGDTPTHQAQEPAAAGLLATRIVYTAQWLQQSPASTYSIQFMGSANETQLDAQLRLLTRQIAIQDIYAYRTEVNGRPFVTVLYGSYPDKASATLAMQQLPGLFKAYQPHLRTIAGILREIGK